MREQVLTEIKSILYKEKKIAELDLHWYVTCILDEEALLSVIDQMMACNQNFMFYCSGTIEYAEVCLKLNRFEELFSFSMFLLFILMKTPLATSVDCYGTMALHLNTIP